MRKGFFRIQHQLAWLLLMIIFVHCGQPGTGSEPIDRHASRLIYTRHARCRMDCRHITEKEIREILEKGEINYGKSEPNAYPDSKYALDGYTQEGQHLRIVFAPTNRGLVVITCIELGVEWECECR
ncbi:MAG TPA: DUF4258 domain-containing protein [Puia sp.]|nr:DUF4258 domain-containing protein [Puia sp.]